jgi:hypothetical protein
VPCFDLVLEFGLSRQIAGANCGRNCWQMMNPLMRPSFVILREVKDPRIPR